MKRQHGNRKDSRSCPQAWEIKSNKEKRSGVRFTRKGEAKSERFSLIGLRIRNRKGNPAGTIGGAGIQQPATNRRRQEDREEAV